MTLSAYLKQHGIRVEILDHCVERGSMLPLTLQNRPTAAFVAQVRERAPDLLGMTLFSRELRDVASLAALLKRHVPGLRLVLGGPHPTAMPRETLAQVPDCDFVVRGEGEEVLRELVTALESGRALADVAGISFRSPTGEMVSTPDAPLLADLDALPLPDREGVLQHYRDRTYSSFVYGSPSDILMTSRGCPYRCRFCFKVCGRYRGRSPARVLEEVDWVVEHIHPASIQLMDDSFTIQRGRAEAILDGLAARRYRVKFKVRSRVDAVDGPLLAKMKRAGVDTVVYGLESGSGSMLRAFDKRTTVEQNVRACRLTRRAGLHCLGDMILFYPGESPATLAETERFLREANPTAVKFYVLTPLPQTQVYSEAKAAGMLVGDWDGSEMTPWVRLPDFAGIESMHAIAKRMYLRSLLRPSRAAAILTAYGGAMARHPRLAARLVLANLRKRMKY
jgi:anaerobic magnesium-protoporphyrin IX monomethyl ester cyclase